MTKIITFPWYLDLNRYVRFALLLSILLVSFSGRAQQRDTVRQVPTLIELQNIDVAPTAVDTKGWLLLDEDIKTELDGAVHNLYNFKFDKAEKQFRSLRRRYPNHPMPYFLMGLSAWWKMLPANVTTKQYDAILFAYMDTATTKAEAQYERNNQNYEACFFLSASYGFSARLHAERHDWTKATVASKRALTYLQKSREANGLSPEFMLGQALFNYYAVWIAEEFPWLRPVLLFFPKGNEELGLSQLKAVAANSFYTGPEACFFLAKIYTSERDENEKVALPVLRKLVVDYPDNAYFARQYARLCFNAGLHKECERVSLDILDKLNRGLIGYDAFSGRYASYFLGFLREAKNHSVSTAKSYYERCIVFSEVTEQVTAGYYLYANLSLAHIAIGENDGPAASRYYRNIASNAEHGSEMYTEAKRFLKANNIKTANQPAPRPRNPALQAAR